MKIVFLVWIYYFKHEFSNIILEISDKKFTRPGKRIHYVDINPLRGSIIFYFDIVAEKTFLYTYSLLQCKTRLDSWVSLGRFYWLYSHYANAGFNMAYAKCLRLELPLGLFTYSKMCSNDLELLIDKGKSGGIMRDF